MGYQDCPCVNCDHKADGEKRVACRKKCTEFTAWKLSMQAIRQKKKEDKDKYYSTTKGKFYKRNLMKQMGICADRVHYKQEYQEMTDRVRQQIIDLCERVRNDKERTEREEKGISE